MGSHCRRLVSTAGRMDQAEELKQITTWLTEEGLAPNSSTEAQLSLLWRSLQQSRSRLSGVTRDLETHRAQHLAEMAEVRKSLEQIRIFTEHKDVLAQEIQDENDRLKDQLRRIISLQDAQISEVAKMLYQQGLTELIHSSPSEQVAYLLVERASLLETCEGPAKLTGDGNATNLLGTAAFNTSSHQTGHKVAPRHGQSTWKRLFGLHKPDSGHPGGQASGLERECSRLERDLEEGSRRLAMAHTEIRRLTDELESAHLTQRAYEPELESAQQEVEQLRHEVENLKKFEMVELRKVKELNDRLDFEIRALRSRVRTLDAEKSSLQQMVVSLQEEVKQLDSALQEQQLHTNQDPANQTVEQAENKAEQLDSPLHKQPSTPVKEQIQAEEKVDAQKAELAQSNQMCRQLQEKVNVQTKHLLQKGFLVESLQKELERLKSVLQEQQQQIVTVQLQADRANQLADSRTAELIQSSQTCKDLQNQLRSLQQQQQQQQQLWDDSHDDLAELIAKIRTQENHPQDQKTWKQQKADSQLWEKSQQEESYKIEDKGKQTPTYEENKPQKCPDNQEAMKTLLSTQEECESLKEEICETLKCLDKEQSKYHELKERHKTKLCRAKQKFADVTAWHNERINKLERELSLCSHSLTKEKELVKSMNVENEKLLCERRKLLQQLDEEEHGKKDLHLSALLSKRRVEFLEAENKKLGNKVLHLSNQLGVLQRSLQNTNSLHFAEELKKILTHQQVPVQTSSVTSPERPPAQASLDRAHSSHTKRTDSLSCSSPPSGSLTRSAEMGYLNVATQGQTDPSAPPGAISDSESVLC